MDFVAVIIETVSGAEVIGLIALMIANVLLSICAAVKNNAFSFRNLGDFIPKRLLPLVAYLLVAVLARVSGGWTAAVIAIYAGLVAMYGAGICAAVKSLTGVSIPNIFSEKS